MECPRCEEIVSAHLDGEDHPGEWEQALSHLAACARCRAFEGEAGAIHRATRLAPAEVVPDLSAAILAAADGPAVEPRTAEVRRTLRVTLAVVGLVQIVLALPALLGSDSGLPIHDSRHMGSFDVALAVGFLYAAWRPTRALAGVLPVAAALVTCLVGTALLDVVAQRTDALGELPHVSELVGLMALWLLAPQAGRRDLRIA